MENDLNKSAEAKKIIQKVYNAINNYNGDTDIVAYDNNVKIFYCKINDLEFLLFDINSPSPAAQNAHERGSGGMYNKEQNRIIDFHANTRTLYHEIIHYLDFKNTDINKFKGKAQKLSDKTDYLNQSPELNAHWFERIVPLIEELINGGEETKNVIKQHGFETFKQILFNYEDVYSYFQHLNHKNKKRFLKRIAEYYQKNN